MATFRVHNISGSRLAVPPPLDVILAAGATAESADTAAIADLLDRGLIAVIRVTSGLASDGVEESTLNLSGTDSSTTVGTLAAPITIGAGETLTFTHALGAKAEKINVYDDNGANFTANADLAIAQPSANAVTVTSTAGGDFVVEIEFGAGVENDMGSNLAADDSRVAVA
jgi:hypothetical protein